jgi:hypothetical protein
MTRSQKMLLKKRCNHLRQTIAKTTDEKEIRRLHEKIRVCQTMVDDECSYDDIVVTMDDLHRVPPKQLTTTLSSTYYDWRSTYSSITHVVSSRKFVKYFRRGEVVERAVQLHDFTKERGSIAVRSLLLPPPSVHLMRVALSTYRGRGEVLKKKDTRQIYDEMCFYCGKTCRDQVTHVDHVIPIMQMFIGVVRDKRSDYNYEHVHACCNLRASNRGLNELWESVGNEEYFPGPDGVEYSSLGSNALNLRDERMRWCRGYLCYEILRHMHFNGVQEQRRLRDVLCKANDTLKNCLSEVKLLMK